jgi:N-acetylglucosamine-6-phosphate deacetylase
METCEKSSDTWARDVSELIIDAASVITPTERFAPGRVVIRDGIIEAVGVISDVRIDARAERIDATDLAIVPGFIDPHVHGCAGVDVMDATTDSIGRISRTLAKHGTTAFLPTTVSSPADVLGSVIERLGSVLRESFAGATPLGLHLEGPFISVARRGTHRAASLQHPSPLLFAEWNKQSAGMLKLITMAPELDSAETVARLAHDSGVVVAIGHSDASYEEARDAIDKGACYAVHTFNAMRPLMHRDPGVVGAVLDDERVFAEIIADGVHVSPEVVRIFSRAKRVDRVILATDAISATGMPDGEYVLGTDSVRVTGGVCRDADGRLAGSTLTQDAALKNYIQWTGVRLEDALMGLTLNPARALKLDGRGQIAPGARADLVLLDSELHVVKTLVAGKIVVETNSWTN